MLHKEVYNNFNIVITSSKISYITERGVQEKEINFTVWDIRNQLNLIGYVCPYDKSTYSQYYSEKLENHSIPYMNFIYYYLLYKLLRIPTFEEYVETYIQVYCNKLSNGMYAIKDFFEDSDFSFTKEQLMGRMSRSYNSFHREIEFFLQMKEYEGVTIIYDFQNDLNGIDFTVDFKGKRFYLASYMASNNSYSWKEQKNTVRHDYSDKEMINIVAKFKEDDPEKNCDSYNGVYTYSPIFVAKTYFEMVKRTDK